MKVAITFPRTIDGVRTEVVELSRVPCEGEIIAIGDECYTVRGSVIHYANPRKDAPVAEVRM